MSYFFSRVRRLSGMLYQDWYRELAKHGEAYRDHAVLWRLFPGDGVPRDFVFRSQEESDSYFVVSARPPQPSAGLIEVQTKPYSPKLLEGEWLQFDLRANPTVSLRVGDGEPAKARSRRHDVLMHARKNAGPEDDLASVREAAGVKWLLDRAAAWGLEVEPEQLQQNAYRQHRLRHKGRHIEFSSLDYQGVARVTAPDRLESALLHGVGHARGFGCGLLLVRRVS